REITFWHEIHTVHKTREEALEEMEKHKEIYNFIWKEVLCIPPIIVEKPKYEIFPGAESAFEFYSILPNGKLLENGSINNLGQAYAKKFDLFFVNENGEKQYVWQVCTGNGARFLVAAFTLHGDERGLVLPPKISPYQVIIITIPTKENDFFDEAEKLSEEFNKENIRVFVDKSEKIPGEKFNIWDIKGVPIRIEIGEKEVKEKFYTLYRRDTKERIKVKVDEIVNKIKKILEIEMPKFLFEKVEKYYKNIIVSCNELSEVEKCIKEGKIAKANWCGDKECFEKISQIESSVEAIGFLEEREFGKCIICNKETDRLTLIGKVY
ncbi:MAG: His/Gly/Thr/Pro-type tRNA ligase C-terminal domain-containing protein, partial [Candidatus Aenigmatarchaeota archaeon]